MKAVPSRRLMWIIGAAILLLGAVYLLVAPRPLKVELIEIQRADAVRALAVNGRIRPRQSIEVKSPVAGTLTELPFDVGDRIDARTLLARIDDGPQRAAIAQADAAVAAQQAVVAQARRDFERYRALGQFVTRQRLEEARLAVEQGQSELERLRASRAQAREVQQRSEIRAPFAGVILERPVDPGQTVTIESILYRLADLDSPEVTAEVDETYAAQLRSGTIGLVELAGRPRPLRARVVHIEPRVDEATGAREVRLRFIDPIDFAPSGQTVSVNLVVERRPQAISIPRSAILKPDSDPHVRIVDDEGRVGDRPIRFLDWPAESVIVTDGLEPGMRILADPESAKPESVVEAAG